MHAPSFRLALVPIALAATLSLLGTVAPAVAQSPQLWAEMHWRSIGPPRAGRTRALDGVPSQPNVFYIGFDNGGVWRSTDYGSTWVPIFDDQPAGSIGAIAVAPSDPNVIYVGSGAGIIRPDLSTGDGMYKSIDAGATWTHLGLRDSQMIADIVVDPGNPDRLLVAALGHPYGPNEERGIFRSTDGGASFERVLYRDEYTSGNDLLLDPSDANTVYATLWQQQQSFRESGEFGGSGNGIFKSTDGGTSWRPLTEGLPSVIEANLAAAPSDPNVLYAMVAGTPRPAGGEGPGRDGGTTGTVGLYRSNDAGEHWIPVDVPAGPVGAATAHVDTRPLRRIGGGDLPTIAVDPTDPETLYSATVVMWRSDDGGVHWSAVRGAYGGDDYQKIWINPSDNKIILAVSDQGAVISANRGESWSNWYTQPTAAMYHVTADNDFPYRLCGGQQDSGSACVKSRSDDGMITFHDWHPVQIQEYGIAAPDPRDPDKVYGSSRSDVSLYNRRTGQSANVGPDMGPRGGPYNRDVRTMPLQWSPVDPDLLFYTSNAVWKTTDRGDTWTRISPDLARASWPVPASAGKYASGVEVSPQGTITALSPSPRDVDILWAGTDDGNIQVTMDGGGNWQDVTPPRIKPWTRIFNIEAGHFDNGTAYAAANTMRIDDMNPHFWRTHDGGATWTEINTGIAAGAVANSIREDPRKPGLLYAATETQVWVSFDDGDHWHSLRLDMPAVSVRDIQVKDDDTCLCSDLVAGTHGRGFWILDNVTPLRQMTEAQAAAVAWLFAPATAVRVRFGMNDPTEWTPELPAGENPPPGGLIDYWLATDTAGPVTLEVLDANGQVIRNYSSDDPVLEPDPALHRAAYDAICREDPGAPNCNVPLYWPAPQMVLSTRAGMHRFSWELRYEPLGEEPRAASSRGAVPGHTYPSVNAPWAAPGEYTVRLTVSGQTFTQPLSLRLDPRVQTPAADLELLATLSREMYDDAIAANAAYEQALARLADLGNDPAGAALREQLEALAPPARGGGRGGRGFRGAAPAGPPSLNGVSGALMSAAMSMQDAEVAPTARQIAACDAARAQYNEVMQRWRALQMQVPAQVPARRVASRRARAPDPGPSFLPDASFSAGSSRVPTAAAGPWQHAPQRTLIRQIAVDFKHVFTRKENLFVLGVGLGLAGALSPLDHPIDGSRFNRELYEGGVLDATFDPGSVVGGSAVVAGGALASYGLGKLVSHPEIEDLGRNLIRAEVVTLALTQGLKFAAGRQRPDGSNDRSFPSGHASASFAAATVLEKQYGWRVGLPAYAVAGYIAASRLSEAKHYLSDVIFGASLGILAGRTVAVPIGDKRFAASPLFVHRGTGVQFTLVGGR